jgi:hypothetical protein
MLALRCTLLHYQELCCSLLCRPALPCDAVCTGSYPWSTTHARAQHIRAALNQHWARLIESAHASWSLPVSLPLPGLYRPQPAAAPAEDWPALERTLCSVAARLHASMHQDRACGRATAARTAKSLLRPTLAHSPLFAVASAEATYPVDSTKAAPVSNASQKMRQAPVPLCLGNDFM